MDYKSIIESKYNRQSWQLLLHDIFGSRANLQQQPFKVETSSNLAKKALCLGKITLSDEQTIAVYEVELSDSVDIERNRRGIRDMLASAWRGMHAGAFMFCYRNDESVLRFSYVSESWTFAEDGTYQKESTDTKRFTYLLGEGHRSRTAIQQFEKLRDSGLSLKDLTKAFSVDAVSDMFFDGYKKQYEKIIFYVTGKRMVKVANKWEERQEGKPDKFIMQQFSHFPNPEKAVRDYVKKLMGRIVFLQFLQKKGWLGVSVNAEWGSGDQEFIQNLFDDAKDKDHFIDNVLEALFHDLNTEDKKKLVKYRTPYLNGGLFERDATDDTEFPLPGEYMKSLLDFFASYNFTIDENDPDDAEVGVDPEMLGRIFENLLEDNKDKGAFYTPKEIVTYMCRESLIAYLQTDIEDEATKEALRQFVTTHEVETLGTNAKLHQQVDEALKEVKICDPAIGSGAFPMGLLKELFLCRTALEGIEQSKAAEIKKHIIQQNIYGVDIEKGAVDIARLRFWLSLIVDEETPQALPNLDFKIMQGNSLLEQYKGVDLSTMTEKKYDKNEGLSWFDNLVDAYREELRNKLNKYYNCTDHNEKTQLRASIIENVKKQLAEQSINVDFGDLDLAGNDQFMLWHTWFYDVFSKGGFDIVIGNPPYISSETQKKTETLLKQREILNINTKYKTLCSKWDIYVAFVELGISHILKENGICTMIVPYPLTNQIYSQKLRRLIINQFDLFELGDFSGIQVFDNATVTNCVPFIRKSSYLGKTIISNIDSALKIEKAFVQTKDNLIQDEKKYVWNTTPLKRNTKQYENMNVLGDYCYCSYGLRPNSDEKTAKGEFKKADLISEHEDCIHCRMYVEAKDVDTYCIKRVRYLEYNTDRSPSKFTRPTFRELYMFPKLMINAIGISIRGMIDYNNLIHNHSLIACVLWKDLHCVNNASILGSVQKYSKLSRCEMEEKSQTMDLRYLLGLLNSKYAVSVLSNLRGEGISIYPETIRNFPIPSPNQEQMKTIVSLVDRIIEAKKHGSQLDTTALESEIDRLVYHLYGLTYDEVLIVDPETPITREEYENS